MCLIDMNRLQMKKIRYEHKLQKNIDRYCNDEITTKRYRKIKIYYEAKLEKVSKALGK